MAPRNPSILAMRILHAKLAGSAVFLALACTFSVPLAARDPNPSRSSASGGRLISGKGPEHFHAPQDAPGAFLIGQCVRAMGASDKASAIPWKPTGCLLVLCANNSHCFHDNKFQLMPEITLEQKAHSHSQ